MSDLSWLNPTPHAIAVYASQPLSPVATQHSLPSGRYSLLGPDLHRLDRTSFAWRTHSITSSAGASSCAGSIPRALDVVRLMTGAPPLPFCSADERVHDMPRKPPVPRPSMISRRNASLHLRLQNLPPHERCVTMPNGPPQ